MSRTRPSLLLAIYLIIVVCQAEDSIKHLVPDEPLSGETIAWNKHLFYKIDADSLQPHTTYEIRVSYAATNPSFFDISFVSQSIEGPSRTLLNIEKIMFKTDENSLILGQPKPQEDGREYSIKVHALQEGVSPSEQDKEVRFNVVLETLYLGIPKDVLTIAIVVVFVLLVTVKMAIPQLLAFLRKLNVESDHTS